MVNQNSNFYLGSNTDLNGKYTNISAIFNVLTFDPAVNQGTGASGQRHQDIALTVDGLNSVQMQRSQEAGGYQTII